MAWLAWNAWTSDGVARRVWAASMKIGPCTAHWPPPEGMKKLTTPPDRNAKKLSVRGGATGFVANLQGFHPLPPLALVPN